MAAASIPELPNLPGWSTPHGEHTPTASSAPNDSHPGKDGHLLQHCGSTFDSRYSPPPHASPARRNSSRHRSSSPPIKMEPYLAGSTTVTTESARRRAGEANLTDGDDRLERRRSGRLSQLGASRSSAPTDRLGIVAGLVLLASRLLHCVEALYSLLPALVSYTSTQSRRSNARAPLGQPGASSRCAAFAVLM